METPEEVKRWLRNGDWQKIAKAAGISYDNARKTLGRPNSRRFNDVLDKARVIAEMNRKLGV